MKFHLGFISVSFLFLVLFLMGFFNILKPATEPNGCNMTYMYKYPQLVKVRLPSGTKNDIKYGLYIYGEGSNINKVRDMKFDGVPVLFIPGNRGSPKQVRSLASVSLSKFLRSRTPIHFDYFAVDLNEDYSALYGGFLKEQTEFVHVCLKRILEIYPIGSKPKSIIIIGHSMGGMIAKGVFLEPNFNHEIVQLIVTLATPHKPAILTDSYLASYYKSVNTFWDSFNATENGVSLVSIGGGYRDILVRSDLTYTEHADVNVMTTMVPGVWLSVDHLCILWCNQLVLVIVRSLFDSIDLNTKQLTTDIELRNKIFSYHLFNRSGGKSFHSSQFPEELDLQDPKNTEWIEMTEKNMLWTKKGGVSHTTNIIISLATPYNGLAIDAVNHKTRDWIFACFLHTATSGVPMCKRGINWSKEGRISPPMEKSKRKSVVLHLSKLRKEHFTHVVIRTLPTKEPVQLYLELFKKRERTVYGGAFLSFKNVAIHRTEKNSSFYSILLPDLSHFWHSYRLYIEPWRGCKVPVYARASISVPWSHEGMTQVFSLENPTVDISVLHGKSLDFDNGTVKADLFLDPRCSYMISLEKSLVLSMSSIVAHSGPSLIAHMACCLLFCMGYQIKCLGSDGHCPLILVVLPLAAKPYFIIQASAILATLLQVITRLFTALPDIDIKIHAGCVELIVVPFFLHLSAFCLTFVLATALMLSVVVQGQAFNGVILRFLKRYSLGLNWLSEYILTGVSKVPVVVSAFMVTIAFSACGGLALCVGLFFYFFKMISLYEDFWEDIVYWPLRFLKWKLKEIRSEDDNSTGEDNACPTVRIPPTNEMSFHLTLLLLWGLVTLISLPSVLVWAQNYKYNNHLEADPYFYSAVVMCVCIGFLWQAELPKPGLKWNRQLGYVLISLGLMVMIYSQINLYRIPYFLSAAFFAISVHQAIGPFFVSEEDGQTVSTSEGVITFSESEPSQAGRMNVEENTVSSDASEEENGEEIKEERSG